MNKRNGTFADNDSKALLNKFALNQNSQDSHSILNKYAGVDKNKKEDESKDIDENVSSRNIPIIRKNRNNLKNIEEMPNKNISITISAKTTYSDLPITGAIKQTKKNSMEFKCEDEGLLKK